MLELRDVKMVYNRGTVDETTLLDHFGLSVNRGEFVSVIGSNGSGKTTLLNLICGTLRPDAGQVLLDGRDITPMPEYKRARFIGRVFQDPKMGTCSGLTVLENFELADNKNKRFDLRASLNRRRIDTYRDLLAECNMGLENRLDMKVGALSGGQRQAIALVLSAMAQVDLLILDEHTAALDPKSSETIMQITDKIVREHALTTVMVTHNLRFAASYGSRLLMMHHGNVVLDKAGEDKQNVKVSDLLTVFNEISIECGN